MQTGTLFIIEAKGLNRLMLFNLFYLQPNSFAAKSIREEIGKEGYTDEFF